VTPRPRAVALLLVVLVTLSGLTPQAGSILDRGGYIFHGPYVHNPGYVLASLAKDRWRDACVPLHFSLNTTADPILDPDGQPAMPLADARAAVEAALRAWNSIPTSYIEMRLDGVTSNPGEPAFDFVNEVTFSSQVPVLGEISGYSRSYFIPLHSTLHQGEDLDGDGDVDITSPASTCRDVDGDGDIELPAGQYAAGTILDTDVVMATNNVYFADLVKDPLAGLSDVRVDLQGVAAHEFGHSHGLGHSNVVDSSITDGTSATMTSTGAFDGYVHMRSLHADDVAWSSYWYPEGSATSGPGALQRGDLAFKKHYALVSGEVRDKLGRPIVGATPYAVGLDGEIVSAALSGTVRLAVNPATLAWGNIDPHTAFADGKYTLPVPRGIYWIGLEADDGMPHVDFANITHGFASNFDRPTFPEEYWSGPFEGADELASGFAWPVLALADRKGVDFIIDDAEQLLATSADPTIPPLVYSVGPGDVLAVRMPADELRAFAGDDKLLIKAVVLGVTPWINEERATLPSVMLTTGRTLPDGSVSIDLERPLLRERRFLIQDSELTPWHILSSEWLGRVVTDTLAGSGRDLFIVAHFPTTAHPTLEKLGVPGIGGIGVFGDLAPPATSVGNTFYSADGGVTFAPTPVDACFGLVVATR
jgi:hypothetical protein